ncbi:MAG: heme-binding protein [Paraburkholderia sp.]|uniref:GlcG/HbpS family heme-binding protein n=1 Tax=Paraburkholderia sp. TaxID=1926495 RepID=UPI0011F6BAEA|nr:heme-binding protein [Paraburkholderia sp.]TAM00481.1 MAG: heme-binding protein [Paraburkholderia sp.]TAM27832.1 MAG: heme-binding protein [Paraburkholderia sp.]
MRTRAVLTDEDIVKMADAAIAHAHTNQWAVTIAVVDEGAHLLWLRRLDGAAPATAEMAISKARTAALGRRESKLYEDVIRQGRTAFLSAPLTAMLEGGVPIVVDGDVIGAIGVSGVKSDQDAAVARAGIAALGIA